LRTASPSSSGLDRTWPERPWVESDDLAHHLQRIGADAETVEFATTLAETGVARIDLGEEGQKLCDAAVRDTEPYFDRPGVTRVQDAWLRSTAVRRLATLPKVLAMLDQAYGRPAFPFQTLNFRRGTEQETHSDAIHFHSEPQRFMCGVWVALEDIAPEAGPLAYRPGSHKLPVLTMRAAGVNHSRPKVEDYKRTYVPALRARLDASNLPSATAVLKKGHALVWAANLAHGGSPIAAPDSTRRSLVTHYYFKGCTYYTPMTSDVEDGRLSVRLPMDLNTGLVALSRRNGRLVAPRPGQVVEALGKILLRRVVT
jgi:hypothetical protein